MLCGCFLHVLPFWSKQSNNYNLAFFFFLFAVINFNCWPNSKLRLNFCINLSTCVNFKKTAQTHPLAETCLLVAALHNREMWIFHPNLGSKCVWLCWEFTCTVARNLSGLRFPAITAACFSDVEHWHKKTLPELFVPDAVAWNLEVFNQDLLHLAFLSGNAASGLHQKSSFLVKARAD